MPAALRPANRAPAAPDASVRAKRPAFYAGYSVRSGGINNALRKPWSQGLVAGWQIAPADVEPKPLGAELREWLRPKLGRAASAILGVLFAAAGGPLTNAEIAH